MDLLDWKFYGKITWAFLKNPAGRRSSVMIQDPLELKASCCRALDDWPLRSAAHQLPPLDDVWNGIDPWLTLCWMLRFDEDKMKIDEVLWEPGTFRPQSPPHRKIPFFGPQGSSSKILAQQHSISSQKLPVFQPPLGPHPAMPGIAVVASVMKFKGILWPWDPNPLDIQKHTANAKGDPDRYMMIYVV